MNTIHILRAFGDWNSFLEFSKAYCESEAAASGSSKTKPGKFRHYLALAFGENFNTNSIKALYDDWEKSQLFYLEGRSLGEQDHFLYVWARDSEDAQRYFVEEVLEEKYAKDGVDAEEAGYIIEESREASPFELFDSPMTPEAKSGLSQLLPPTKKHQTGKDTGMRSGYENSSSDRYNLTTSFELTSQEEGWNDATENRILLDYITKYANPEHFAAHVESYESDKEETVQIGDIDLETDCKPYSITITDNNSGHVIAWAEPCPKRENWHWNINSIDPLGPEIESGSTPMKGTNPRNFGQQLTKMAVEANWPGVEYRIPTYCSECGRPMTITEDGIAHHLTHEEGDVSDIDHDADADHTPVQEK